MAAIVRFLLQVFSRLPLPVIHGIGTAIGYGFFVFPNRRRSTTLTNLSLCFPELTSTERKILSRKSLLETGKGLVETSTLWLGNQERVIGWIREIEGVDAIKNAMTRGKGVVLAAPHLGCWEMIGLYCSMHFHITSLYRPPPMAGMEQTMRRARERFGAKLVPTDRSGIKALYRGLEAGEMVGILPDQDPGNSGGVFAPFFNVPANTMTLLSRLAARTGAEVFFGYARRLPSGSGYKLYFVRGSATINNPDLRISARALNEGVEQCIRLIPEQYLWCYKRFRTRPRGEKKLYSR